MPGFELAPYHDYNKGCKEFARYMDSLKTC